MRRFLIAAALTVALPIVGISAATAQGVGFSPAVRGSAAPTAADIASAKTLMPVPSAQTVQSLLASAGGAPGGTKGSSSSFDGKTVSPGGIQGSTFESQAYGTGAYPFTTARVASWATGPYLGVDSPVTAYPWRPAGKLWMYFASTTGKAAGWYVCTASMIRRNVAITAAHCVHNYGRGSSGWASTVYFIPAEYNTGFDGPYGVWRAKWWGIPTPYFNGTDTCSTVGVVCNNDLATVVFWKNNTGAAADNQANFVGNYTGWYSYGWNGYSYVTSSYLGNKYAGQIAQLGYPVALDQGAKMERTDSVIQYTVSGNLRNQIWGSAQTGGSSGGPEIVNFGTSPTFGSGSSAGSAPNRVVVVGVTSWGYTNSAIKIQGASFFGQNIQYPGSNYSGWGAGNIGFMVSFACGNFASSCS